jgi:RNA polymerase sigma factor (sigma-70 family)
VRVPEPDATPEASARHISPAGVVTDDVSVQTEAATRAEAPTESFDFETVFRTHYRRIARVIFRVVQDPSRAEELAVEVFWKLWRHPSAQGPHCAAWLHRSAVRVGLDELRKRSRREKYERWFGFNSSSGDPERARETNEERMRIRTVLASLRSQDAQLVALRAEGLSYEELSEALAVKPTSIGTMLRRAQEGFRKEYVKRYGEA